MSLPPLDDCRFDDPPLEEGRIVALDTWDVEILDTIDAFLVDDEILSTAIIRSVQETQCTGQTLIDFITKVILRRLGEEASTLQLPTDLRPLTSRAWTSLSCAVIIALQEQMHRATNGLHWRYWMTSGVLLLLSAYSQNITTDTADTIKACLLRNQAAVCSTVASADCFGVDDIRTESLMGQVLENFGVVLKSLGDDQHAFHVLEEVVGRRIYKTGYDGNQFNSRSMANSPWRSAMTSGNLRCMAKLAVDILERQCQKHSPSQWEPWMENVLSFVINTMAELEDYSRRGELVYCGNNQLAGALRSWLINDTLSPVCLRLLGQISGEHFLGGNYIVNALQGLNLRDEGEQRF